MQAHNIKTHSQRLLHPTHASRAVAGWSSPVARQAHNLKVTGSNPVPATILICNASSVTAAGAFCVSAPAHRSNIYVSAPSDWTDNEAILSAGVAVAISEWIRSTAAHPGFKVLLKSVPLRVPVEGASIKKCCVGLRDRDRRTEAFDVKPLNQRACLAYAECAFPRKTSLIALSKCESISAAASVGARSAIACAMS